MDDPEAILRGRSAGGAVNVGIVWSMDPIWVFPTMGVPPNHQF